MTPPPDLAARRAWRIALVAYLVPLTVTTHWPRLAIGGPQGGIDKLAHFLGFGLLAWIAMHASPPRRAFLGWLCVAAWVFIDERTQAIEILGRVFSTADMVAGWIGVAIAGALYLVREPNALVAGPARDEAHAHEALAHAHPRAWRRGLGLAIATMLVTGGMILGRDLVRGDEVTPAAIVFAIGIGGFVGVVLATAVGLRLARFEWERLHGRPAVRTHIPAWSWAVAAAVFVSLVLGYEACVEAWFGAEPPEELAADHLGFTVLGRAFAIASALLAILAGDAIAVRFAAPSRVRVP